MLFFKIAFFFFLFSSFCYLAGFLSLGRKSIFNDFIKDLLFKLIFGSIVLVAVLSLFKTSGKTIYLAFLPLILYTVYHNRFNGSLIEHKLKVNNLLIVFLQMIFAIALSFLLIQGDLINGQKALHLDQVYYASLAESIWQTGLESFQSVYLNNISDIASSPYHYFELWLTGFAKNIFNVNSLFALNGIVFPFYVFLFSLTVYVFLRENISQNQVFILFAMSVVFFLTNGFSLFNNELSVILYDGGIKNIYPISFALFSFFLFKEGKLTHSFVFILLTSLVNIVIFPAMVGGLFSYLLIIFIFFRKDFIGLTKDNYFVISIVLFFLLFAIYLFYIASSNQETGMQKSLGGLLYNIRDNSILWFKEQFLLVGAVLFFTYKSSNINLKKIVLFVFCIAVMAVFSRALLDNNQNAFQILNAIKFIVNYVLLLVLLILFLDYFKNSRTIVLISVILLSVAQFLLGFKYFDHNFRSKIYAYTSEYVNELNAIEIKNPVGVKVVNASLRPLLQRNPVYIGFCNYMPFIKNIKTTVVLNIDSLLTEDIPGFKSNINIEFINSSFFVSQTNYQVRSGLSSWENSILIYLSKLKPQFCIVEEGVELPMVLEKFVLKEITDSGTGEKFYLLNTSQM
jgi:hypothetical protein